VDATRSETLTFSYDELDRLDMVSGPYSHNYDYNAIGNLTAKNTTTYTYGDAAHKHAATALSTGESYGYDANGNMTARSEGGSAYTQVFDAENRLVSVTVGGLTTQFLYDPDGNLVKKINSDNTKTIYVAGIYEVNKSAGGTVTGTKTYYPAGGAMRVDGTRYYILKDHLNSASVVTNQSGTIVGEDRFYPFGETRFTTGDMKTDKLFTGQRQIAGLGIYHYNARFYSPKLGRFLSADTIVPGYANPQVLNRYSYVMNNPIRYNDPTGHKYCDSQDSGDCRRLSNSIEHTAIKYRIRFKGNWNGHVKEQLAVLAAVEIVGATFASAREIGESASEAFGAVYGHVNIGWGGIGATGTQCPAVTSGGCTSSSQQINFWSMSGHMQNDMSRMIKNVVHELGHAFDNSLAYPDPNPDPVIGRMRRPDEDMPSGMTRDTVLRPNPIAGRLDWQQSDQNTSNEIFADMFIAWTYDAWNTDSANQKRVTAAQAFMISLVP
jgi:RHS repeat-associated protein